MRFYTPKGIISQNIHISRKNKSCISAKITEIQHFLSIFRAVTIKIIYFKILIMSIFAMVQVL